MRTPAVGVVLLLGLVGCGREQAPVAAVPPVLSIPAAPDPASQRIVELLAHGESDKALQQATEFVEKQPKNPAAYDARATIYHKLGLVSEALADLDRAVELDPKNARLRNNRGYLRLAGQLFDDALADFEEANRLAPEYANAYNNRGLVEIAQGRYRQAIDDLDRALQRDPKYVDAYNNRGFAYLQLGRFDRALGDFNAAVQLNPKYVNAYNNRGLAKQRLGDVAGAVNDFTEAMMLDPQNPKYYGHRRDAYLAQGLFEQARADERKIVFLARLRELTAAVQLKPNVPAGYLARAKHYQLQGDESQALGDLQRALEIAPGHIPALLQRAAMRCELKQYPAAIADCNAVLEQQPQQQAYSIRADCHMAQRDLDAAIADFEAARRLDTAVAEAYYRKSQDLTRRGEADEAKTFIDRAEELEPGIVERLR
jgi:tetratricopeptide (TPR) repeat protein